MANPNSKLEVSRNKDTYRARNIYYRKLKNDVSYSFSFRLDKKLAFVTVGREVRDRLTLEKLMNANEDFERLMREYNVVPAVEAVNGKINISMPKEITKDYSKFDDIAQYYFEHKKEQSNTHNLTLAYNKNMKDFFSAYKIEDITYDELMKFRAFLYAKKIGVKKVDGKMTAGRKMSDKTVQDYLNNIKTIFNYAIQQNKFKLANPAKDIKMKKIDNDSI
ncbi:MAG: phage integrase SAM-like domain-containing protein [Candidatus Staskawiczbacteria bacterium]|nr:phage integrase SAM-like domain-containing protein [Candidatus Staskawiczbacteria bacterium]